MKTWMTALFVSASIVAVPAADAGKPPDAGGGGGKIPPNPDVVYLSDDNSTAALSQAAVRGIELARSRDFSLLKSKAGRDYQAVAWSPDGTLIAWIELGLGMVSTPHHLMVAPPGSRPRAVYTSEPGDGKPQLQRGTDVLAWGRVDCAATSGARSLLVFTGGQPDGIYAIEFVDGSASGAPLQLMAWTAATTGWSLLPRAFAFSPHGQYLAFAGSYGDSSSHEYGAWALPLCGSFPAEPSMIIDGSVIGGSEPGPIMSIDWSRAGERLALSVTTGTDLPWRDLMVAGLNYAYEEGVEQLLPSDTVCRIDLDGDFGTASSEHSPQWGPGDVQVAFSQSSDLGRALFLLDVDTTGCGFQSLTALPSRWPRALDWK